MSDHTVMEQVQEVYTATGCALTNWSFVEIELSHLYSAAMLPDERRRSELIFNTIISFDTRLAVCGKAIELSSNFKETSALWTSISTRLSKLYKRRHTIAHSTLSEKAGRGWGVSPFMQSTDMYEKSRDGDTIFVNQINEMAKDFLEMIDAMQWFEGEIRSQSAPCLESLAQDHQPDSLVARIVASAIQKIARQARQEQPSG